MAKFTLFALVAVSLFIKLAYHGLGIHTKGHFLYLNGLEEFCGILSGLFLGSLFGGSTRLFGFFPFLVGVLVGFGLRFELGYLSAGASSFFLSFRVRIVESSHVDWARSVPLGLTYIFHTKRLHTVSLTPQIFFLDKTHLILHRRLLLLGLICSFLWRHLGDGPFPGLGSRLYGCINGAKMNVAR